MAAAATGAGTAATVPAAAPELAWSTAGSGPPLLLLHGIPSSRELWWPVVERLAGSFTCITPDLPGLGQSPPLPEGSHDLDDIAAALEALRAWLGIERWAVAGHDAGATVAVHYAAGHPERVTRLALLAPPVYPELRPPWFFRLLRAPVIGPLAAPAAVPLLFGPGLRGILAGGGEGLGPVLASFAAPFRGWRGARRLVRLLRWGDPATVLSRTAALLPRIAAPTLILHGRRDGAIPAAFSERAAREIPGARAVFYDSGHFLPLDLPAEVAEQLRRHCDGGVVGLVADDVVEGFGVEPQLNEQQSAT